MAHEAARDDANAEADPASNAFANAAADHKETHIDHNNGKLPPGPDYPSTHQKAQKASDETSF